MDYFLIYLFSFFIGAIPFYFLARKIDQRKIIAKISSGSFDKARLHLILDPWLVLLVDGLDIAKAFLLTVFSLNYFDSYIVMILMSLFMLLGHIFSNFLINKKKKIATPLMGVLFAYDWRVFIIAIVFYFFILILFHYHRLVLLIVSLLVPFLFYFLNGNLFLVAFSWLVFILLVVLHIPNIQRFLAGEEPTIDEIFVEHRKKC